MFLSSNAALKGRSFTAVLAATGIRLPHETKIPRRFAARKNKAG